ncbi:hypothetical protein BV20DRAFT_1048674 [Pilatotrama ljubarskyi]|nr:hypothetical protein BV20DRAFT_1048674 [Pilatotrama ljubarskyi]
MAPAIDGTFGAILLGNFVGLILYGQTLHMLYRYATTYPGDSRRLKTLVYLAVLLETISAAMGMHSCYHYLVRSYFRPEALQIGTWSLNLQPLALGLAMVVSQSFFARRLWLLGGRYWIIVIFAVLCYVAELGLLLGEYPLLTPRPDQRNNNTPSIPTAATAKLFVVDNIDVVKMIALLIPTSFAFALAADLVLTVALVHVLHRSRTGLKSTDTMIDVLIMYTVSTGLLTGVVDILATVFAFARSGDFIYVAFTICGARLYAITLLTALNSRKSIAAHGMASAEITGNSPFGFSIARNPVDPSMISVHTHPLRPDISTIDRDAFELSVASRKHTATGDGRTVDLKATSQ